MPFRSIVLDFSFERGELALARFTISPPALGAGSLLLSSGLLLSSDLLLSSGLLTSSGIPSQQYFSS